MRKTEFPRTAARAGISRRCFLVAAGTGVGLSAAAQAGLPLYAAATVPPLPAAPLDNLPTTGAVKPRSMPWLQREQDETTNPPHTIHWHQHHSDGAAMQFNRDGWCYVDEPGWGRHCFHPADFATGAPQDTVRRVFGESAVRELERERSLQIEPALFG